MNRRRLFKLLALAPFALPAIAKAMDRRNKQFALYAEQAEVYRRLRAMAVATEQPVWYAPAGLNRGDQLPLGRTVYYVHLDESNFRLERI